MVVCFLNTINFFLLGCTVPKNPSYCNQDSECAGYIHPVSFGVEGIERQCANKDFVNSLISSNPLVKMDNTINCECKLIDDNAVPKQIFGMGKGMCLNKDINWK